MNKTFPFYGITNPPPDRGRAVRWVVFTDIFFMDVNSLVRIENKNYNRVGIETIFLIKKKIMLFLRNLALGRYSL